MARIPVSSLLELTQGLLERTYGMPRVVADVGRYVIGDHGYRRFYAGVPQVTVPSSQAGETAARTLVRETDEGLRVCVYYPNALIRSLELHPPQRGLRDDNVDAFGVLVEELDHLLCLADRAEAARPVSLFELELHANVSKHLVLSRFLAGTRRRIGSHDKAWLRYHLFLKGAFAEREPGLGERYRDAVRWALRFLDGLERLAVPARIETLRGFHRAGANGKLQLIGGLAS
jgi:hypothetical protein